MNVDEILTYRRAGRNPVAKAVRTPEFRTRIVPLAKQYNRKKFRKIDLTRDSD